MVGKMCLAWVAIFPLKDGSGSGGQAGGVGDAAGSAAVANESAAGSAEIARIELGIDNNGELSPRQDEGPVSGSF